MLNGIKKLYSILFRFLIAIIFILFTLLVFLTVGFKDLSRNTTLVTTISLGAIIFSLPGIATQLAEELNPKKKKFKLTCKCPNCENFIEMKMEEE